jgi:RNA polymerase sigma factor for flagellar operon FliA
MVTTSKSTQKQSRKAKTIRPIVEDTVTSSRTTQTNGRGRRWDVTMRDWRRFQKSPTAEMRQRLLAKYVPLVRNVATRMAMGFPRSVELTDLVNTGVIGLIEAFGNFDPERGVKFETYAVPRIRGAILDELRALDWVPRSTRARSREIDRALNELENVLGRLPEKAELARHLEISEAELYHALDDVSGTNVLSLDEIVYPEDDNRQVPRIETVQDANSLSVLGIIERGELHSYLVTAIDLLTQQEKLVISLYYFEELTLKEIGEVMVISESRVSQIHTRAVKKLRSMVKERFAMAG